MNRNNRPGGNGPGIPGNIPGNPVNISTNLRPMPAPTSAKNANGLSLTHCQDLRPPMRGINLECILLEAKEEPRRTIDHQLVTSWWVADKTGSINLTFWGEDVKYLRPGDIVRVINGEAKLYKGNLQVATSKFGSYKKIGEDTFPFSEVPKWSEYQWVQDPHNRNMLLPLTPQVQQMLEMNGGVPPPVGASSQRNPGATAVVNPAFRGNMGAMGGMGGMGNRFPPQGGPGNQGAPGFDPNHKNPGPGFNHNNNNNSNTNNNFNGGPNGSIGPGAPGAPGASGGPVGPGGPGGPRQGFPPGPNPGNTQGGPANGPGVGNGSSGGGRHGKHGKHGKMHRDLDAPDSYPSPRTGLNNSVDEFARDMKLVSQGGSLGMGPHFGHTPGHQGGGHMRKRPKVEID
ncbi:SOSS complex subunit B1 [Podila verticillata]|nr:SOSS complex subunit B1 [Podila verticillata]